jgi:hypothetical protein
LSPEAISSSFFFNLLLLLLLLLLMLLLLLLLLLLLMLFLAKFVLLDTLWPFAAAAEDAVPAFDGEGVAR